MAGIYIHIPFCHQACTYCNFHFSTSTGKKSELVDALIREIGLHQPTYLQEAVVQTVYFGGGTPSILDNDELKRIMDALRMVYSMAPDAEVTLEANPDDINPFRLQHWLEMGVNRLSVGIQSFHEEELRWMNRTHSAEDSLRCLYEIREAGFNNFSADLIYGSPLQTDSILDNNIARMLENRVPHLSCYALTVEPKTILQHRIDRKESQEPDPDRQSEQFLHLMHRLTEAGYEHYEISNFALPGHRSRHNSSYWKGLPYLGLGPSAHSYDGLRKRQWNIANNSLYISSINNGILPCEEETLTDTQLLNEYIMTALRTSEGISLPVVTEKFGQSQSDRLDTMSALPIYQGKIIKDQETIRLTNEGKLLADGIASDFFL